MLQVIVNAIFKVIAFIGGVVMSPIVAIVNALIPDFSTFISGILNFVAQGLTYVPFILRLFMIPNYCLAIVYLYFTAYVTFKIGFASYKLILKLYNKFKP